MSEIPNPEQTNLSPEQRAVATLTASAQEVLDAYGGEPVVAEDGTSTRTAEAGSFSPSVSETVLPDGSRSFALQTFYNQQDDRGTKTWSWQEGGTTIDFHGNFEIKGVSNSTEVAQEDVPNSILNDNIKYVGRKMAERSALQTSQKGKISRWLSRLSLRG